MEKLTKETAALFMDGREYGDELPPPVENQTFTERLAAARLICLFGYSDDVVEVRGVVNDEFGAGHTLYFTSEGLLKSECEEGEECPYFKKLTAIAVSVDSKYGGDQFGLWDWQTSIPFSRFKIMEDGEVYGSGIVFSLDELVA